MTLKKIDDSYLASANQIKDIFEETIDIINNWKMAVLKVRV